MAVLERLSAADQKRYAGQWVALKNGKVVLAAVSADDVLRRIHDAGLEPDLVARIPAPDDPQTWVF